MDDLISRQAAIEGADKIIERDTSGNNDVVKAMQAWKVWIMALPTASDWDRYSKKLWKEAYERGKRDGQSSAQPNLQPTCNQLATDLISRQAAIDALENTKEVAR